jgi:hypothetical protein
MLGSVVGLVVEVGEADGVVGAATVVVGEELAVLEGVASGLSASPHPASSIDAASGTTTRATQLFFTAFQLAAFLLTVSPTVLCSNGAVSQLCCVRTGWVPKVLCFEGAVFQR